MSPVTSEDRPTSLDSILDTARKLIADGRALEAIPMLREAAHSHDSAPVDCELAKARNRAFKELQPASRFASWPVPVEDPDTSAPCIPEVDAADLTADALRRAILGHGSLKVKGLLDDAQVESFRDGIKKALQTREDTRDNPYRSAPNSWFSGLQLPQAEAQSLSRNWIAGAGGVLSCDSPRVLEMIFSTYEDIGVIDVLTEYLGERPVLSANKCTLRRVPLTANTDWHQDGAFIGQGIRAMNVWIALTDCGVDAPGMDIVPRRFEDIIETGTGGSIFDWAVGPEVVAELSVDHPVIRPQFRQGDALLFDDLFLHRSAVSPEMVHERFAIESWFFAKTDYPEGQVPLVS